MDGEKFDELIRRVSTIRLTRGNTLRGLVAAAATALTGATLAEDETDAKNKHRKGGHAAHKEGKKGKGKNKKKKNKNSGSKGSQGSQGDQSQPQTRSGSRATVSAAAEPVQCACADDLSPKRCPATGDTELTCKTCAGITKGSVQVVCDANGQPFCQCQATGQGGGAGCEVGGVHYDPGQTVDVCSPVACPDTACTPTPCQTSCTCNATTGFCDCVDKVCNTPPGPCFEETGTCVNGDCVYQPKPAGTECGVSGGICQDTPTCDGSGTCNPNFKPNTFECRAAAGVCDVAEVCTGSSAECPPDVFATGTVCRPAAGPCDVEEVCTGSSADCPADAFATGTVCRASVGQCDVAEVCPGDSATCPADQFQPNGTPCDDGDICTRTDTCQDGVCVGIPCPVGTTCERDTGRCLCAIKPGQNKTFLCFGRNGHGDKCCPVDSVCDYSPSGAVNCRNI